MKTTNQYFNYLTDFMRFLGKIAKAIVSGMTVQKAYSKPNGESKVYISDEEMKPDFKKQYYRSSSKPIVEKQTLSKEIKKVRGSNK